MMRRTLAIVSLFAVSCATAPVYQTLPARQSLNLPYSDAVRAGLQVKEIRHSHKKRAQQTAEIFAKHLKCEAKPIDGISPNDDAEAFAESVEDGVLFVSHLPFLSYAVSTLVGNPRPTIDLHPATLVGLVRIDEHYLVDFVIHPALVT